MKKSTYRNLLYANNKNYYQKEKENSLIYYFIIQVRYL